MTVVGAISRSRFTATDAGTWRHLGWVVSVVGSVRWGSGRGCYTSTNAGTWRHLRGVMTVVWAVGGNAASNTSTGHL